jgi:hypothetical protein
MPVGRLTVGTCRHRPCSIAVDLERHHLVRVDHHPGQAGGDRLASRTTPVPIAMTVPTAGCGHIVGGRQRRSDVTGRSFCCDRATRGGRRGQNISFVVRTKLMFFLVKFRSRGVASTLLCICHNSDPPGGIVLGTP